MTVTSIGKEGPNEELIKTFEYLLEKAKGGEIHGIAYAVNWTGVDTGSGWDTPNTPGQAMALIGELRLLEFRLITQIMDVYLPEEA